MFSFSNRQFTFAPQRWVSEPSPYSRCAIRILHSLVYHFIKINSLLTERKCLTEELWSDFLTVQTEHSEVWTETKEGQYSQVRFEQAKVAILVRSSFYATQTNLFYFKFADFCDLKDMAYNRRRSVWQSTDQVRNNQNSRIYLRTTLLYKKS